MNSSDSEYETVTSTTSSSSIFSTSEESEDIDDGIDEELKKELRLLKNENYLYEGIDLSQFIPKENCGVLEIIKSVVKHISPTNPVYRIAIPIEIIQPLSFLERLSKHSNPSNFLSNIQDVDSPEERFIRMVKWQFSTWGKINRIGFAGQKPYNPIVGEFFTCHWDHHEDESRTYAIYEQVSHHPPISSFYAENEKRRWVWKGNLYPSVRLQGLNTIGSYILGNMKAVLHPLKKKKKKKKKRSKNKQQQEEHEGEEEEEDFEEEEYVYQFPSVAGTGVFWSKPARVEISSGMTFQCRCLKTGYSCDINFLSGIVKKKLNPIKGYIKKEDTILYTIIGNMDQKTYILKGDYTKLKWKKIFQQKLDQKKTPIFVDFTNLKVDEKYIKPLEEQKVNESRRVWHNVTRSLLKRDLRTADREKSNIEGEQRKLRKLRKKKKIPDPQLLTVFHPAGNCSGDGGVKTDAEAREYCKNEWVINQEYREFLLDGKL